MGKVNFTPNERVNQMAGFSWPAGDVIPHYWRQTIVDPSKARNGKTGKPEWLAMLILSHIVYKYMPYEEARYVGDEHIIDYRMKFDRRHEFYQTSYRELASLFNETKDRIRAALAVLEELGAIKRILTTESYHGQILNNCLNIDIDIDRLKQLTFPAPAEGSAAGVGSESDPTYGEKRTQVGPVSGPPYGENPAPLPPDLPPRTLRKTYENKNPNPAEAGGPLPLDADGFGSGSIEDEKPPTIIPAMEGLGDSEEFRAAWDAVPASKRTARSKRAALGAWTDAVRERGIDGSLISEGYRSYADIRREEGCEERYIAALSTWISPSQPMEGLTLESLVEARRRADEVHRAEEEARASATAEDAAEEREERFIGELIATDEEARRLHALAFPDTPSRRITDRLEHLRAWSAYLAEKRNHAASEGAA